MGTDHVGEGAMGSSLPPRGQRSRSKAPHPRQDVRAERGWRAEGPSPAQAEGARPCVLADDFRRTVASSILKWVVSQQSSRSKPRSRREKARDSSASRKGVLAGRPAGPWAGLPGSVGGAAPPPVSSRRIRREWHSWVMSEVWPTVGLGLQNSNLSLFWLLFT